MGLFYHVSPKELLKIRNEIFITEGIPALKKNGFDRAPFSESLFGRNNLGDFTYELCRLNTDSVLDFLQAHIAKGDNWIQIYLNVFKLHPHLESLVQLKNINGMQFRLRPNSETKMRLRMDDFKGMPLFRTVEHKIKTYYTQKGLQKRINELAKLINSDLSNINSFKKRWHELHEPMKTDWEGRNVNKDE
ncbi:MAG: hypothetical protein J0H74_36585 [Chitinophagaceae bacterium]|nr:hypothetical protein [Chitinophagaceae bacterium]